MVAGLSPRHENLFIVSTHNLAINREVIKREPGHHEKLHHDNLTLATLSASGESAEVIPSYSRTPLTHTTYD